jgi:glycosyl transferase family 2
MTTLTAIVPAADERPTLPRCLDAIRAADAPPEELIVADGPAPRGSAQVRNDGAIRATGDLLVFVDSDVEVHPDAFARIREAFDREPELAALFGAYDEAPPGGLVSGFRNLLHAHVHHASAGPACTFWTGLGAVRRDAFLGAGGFDVSSPWIRDVEFGMRLKATGAEIRLDPAIQGRHLKAWRLAEMVRTDFARRGVPWVVLLAQYRAHPAALNLGWRHRVSAALSAAVVGALGARRPRGVAAALLGIVALNRSLYAMLMSRRGLLFGPAGLGLHLLHHLTSVAAVPAGVASYLAAGRPRPPECSFHSLAARSTSPSPTPPPRAEQRTARDERPLGARVRAVLGARRPP